MAGDVESGCSGGGRVVGHSIVPNASSVGIEQVVQLFPLFEESLMLRVDLDKD